MLDHVSIELSDRDPAGDCCHLDAASVCCPLLG